VVCLIVAAALGAAADASPLQRVSVGSGISVVVPHGWRLSRTSITKCGDPAQRLVATSGRVRLHGALRVPAQSALVLLMEARSGRFPARPRRFVLPALGNLGGCCEIPVGRGAELLFRDHGRRFYAFVYLGERAPAGTRSRLLQLLDSIRVSRLR
jgi:hypothetical protein